MHLLEKAFVLGHSSSILSETSASALAVMNRKFKFIDGKGELIAAMLSGELPTAGRRGLEVGD
jgi:hypothetical protein